MNSKTFPKSNHSKAIALKSPIPSAYSVVLSASRLLRHKISQAFNEIATKTLVVLAPTRLENKTRDFSRGYTFLRSREMQRMLKTSLNTIRLLAHRRYIVSSSTHLSEMWIHIIIWMKGDELGRSVIGVLHHDRRLFDLGI